MADWTFSNAAPYQLTIETRENGETRQIYRLHRDGKVEADWHALAALKDKYLAGGDDANELYVAFAAALWLAKNT